MCSVFGLISIENAATGSDLPCAMVACAMLKSERRYRYRCSTYKPTPGTRVTWRSIAKLGSQNTTNLESQKV